MDGHVQNSAHKRLTSPEDTMSVRDLFPLPGAFPTASPAVDLVEHDEDFTISAEVSGLDPQDVQVMVADGYVTIKGEKKKEDREEEAEYFRQERTYGSFQRILALPNSADFDKAEASISKGILTILIPKKANVKSKERKINITETA